MSDETRRARVIFEADGKSAAKVTAEVNAGVVAVGKSADGVGAKAKGAAKQVDLIAKAVGEVAAAHTRQADKIAREVTLLKAAGGAQSQVSKLVREEIALRTKAAAVLGQTAQQAKLLQRAEVEAIKSTAAERRARDSEAAAAARALAAQRKAATAEQVSILQREAQALREQHQILRAIGGEASKIHKLRQDELALLQKAAQIGGRSGEARQLGSTSKVEAAQFGAGQQQAAQATARAKREAADLAGATRTAAEGYKGADASARKFTATIAAGVGPAKSFASSLSSMGLAAMGIGALGGALGAAVQAVDQLAGESLQAQRVSQNLQISISGASAAFEGYVDNITLAKAANKAYQMGVVKDSKEFETLARGVNVLAIKLGEDQAQLLDNAVTAIGRQSRLVLDNLGIILDQASAEKIYAASLKDTQTGLERTAESLDAYEKSIAFAQAATILIGNAAEDAGGKVEGMAAKYAQAKISVENFRQGVLGFDESIGKTREAIRGLAEEELERLSFADFADETSRIGKEVNGYLAQWGVTIDDVDKLAKQLGMTYAELIGQEEKRRAGDAAKVERKRLEANVKANAKALRDQADDLEHEADLREILGIKAKDLLDIQVQALTLRQLAAKAEFEITGELDLQTEQLKIQRDIEKLQLKAASGKDKKGGSKGPTQADRIRAAGEASVQALQAELAELEHAGALIGKLDKQAVAMGEKRLAITLRELAVEREALEATKAKNSVERQLLATKIEQTKLDEEAAKRTAVLEARAAEVELIAKATTEIQAKVAAEANEQARILDMGSFRLRAAGDAIKAEEALALRAAKTDTQRFEIVNKAATASHQNRIAQIKAERDAGLRELDVREELLKSQSGLTDAEKIAQADALKQSAHDKEMLRLTADLDLRRAVGEEQARLAAQAEQTLQRQLAQLNTVVSTVEQVHGELMSKVGDFQGRKRAAESADFDNWKAQQEARADAQTAALDRELDAAEGNASLVSKINRNKAAIQRATQQRLQKAQKDHDRKIEREQQRSEGIQLLVQGAVSTVKAATSYPNIPAMIAHAAAAALAFTYGGMLISGNVPSAKASGASASSGAGAGGSMGSAPSIDRNTSEANKVPDSVPGKAASRNRFRSRSSTGEDGGGNIVNIYGDINALGSIDGMAAEKIGTATGKAVYQREGAA